MVNPPASLVFSIYPFQVRRLFFLRKKKHTGSCSVIGSTCSRSVPCSPTDQAAGLLTVIVSVPVTFTGYRAASSGRSGRGRSRCGAGLGGGGRGRGCRRRLHRRRGRALGARGRRRRGRGHGGGGTDLGGILDAAGGAGGVLTDYDGGDEILVQQGAVHEEAIVDLGDGIVVAEKYWVLAEGGGDGADDLGRSVCRRAGGNDAGGVENLYFGIRKLSKGLFFFIFLFFFWVQMWIYGLALHSQAIPNLLRTCSKSIY